jgi:hypothetical protein
LDLIHCLKQGSSTDLLGANHQVMQRISRMDRHRALHDDAAAPSNIASRARSSERSHAVHPIGDSCPDITTQQPDEIKWPVKVIETLGRVNETLIEGGQYDECHLVTTAGTARAYSAGGR